MIGHNLINNINLCFCLDHHRFVDHHQLLETTDCSILRFSFYILCACSAGVKWPKLAPNSSPPREVQWHIFGDGVIYILVIHGWTTIFLEESIITITSCYVKPEANAQINVLTFTTARLPFIAAMCAHVKLKLNDFRHIFWKYVCKFVCECEPMIVDSGKNGSIILPHFQK